MAWYQFHKRSYIFKNPALSIKKKLRFFDAYVTPSALYGLAAIAITTTSLQTLGIVQRKMLRLMVGWTRVQDETWEATMHQMKMKIKYALERTNIQIWPEA
eukprot:4565612-Karenia_brevis.AAC.1